MFGPKHTFESVAKELADGLEKGTIALHPEEPTEADVENFESMAIKNLAKYQRRLIAQLIVGNLCLVSGAYILWGPDVIYQGDHLRGGILRAGWAISFAGSVLGAAAGFIGGLRSREHWVELKTFIRILKLADAETAKRLVLWERPRLRDRAPAP
jgi:hypothetical protein